MKKLLGYLSTVLLLAMFITGCSGSSDSKNETAEAKTAKKKLKVAMLLPGTINDHGWNAAAYAGLELIQEELGAEIAYSESVKPSDYVEVFRGYASAGYDIVIGHGFEFGDPAKEVAKDFEDVMFFATSTDIYAAPNVGSLNNSNLEQGFLAGVVAAKMTKSNVVGSVGGMKIPSIIIYNDGFEAGVKYINPEIETLTAYIGNFDDAAKAKETAAAMIENGADILTHNCDHASLGLFEAVQESGVYAIGAVADQAHLAPDSVITSAINKVSSAVLLAAKLYEKGELEAKSYQFGVADGAIYLSGYGKFEDKIPAEIKEEIAKITEEVKNGTIDVSSLI